MLTPQEVQDKKFIKAVFGGYDMVTVDEFLEKLNEYYTALFKENTVLKNKLKVLVETVEEYRSVDESMRRALLGAQKIAKDMVSDAKAKSAELMESANNLVEAKRAELEGSLQNEHRKLEAARQQTARFIDTMRSLFQKQIDLLERLPDTVVPISDLAESKLDMKQREIEKSLKNISADIPTASLPDLTGHLNAQSQHSAEIPGAVEAEAVDTGALSPETSDWKSAPQSAEGGEAAGAPASTDLPPGESEPTGQYHPNESIVDHDAFDKALSSTDLDDHDSLDQATTQMPSIELPAVPVTELAESDSAGNSPDNGQSMGEASSEDKYTDSGYTTSGFDIRSALHDPADEELKGNAEITATKDSAIHRESGENN